MSQSSGGDHIGVKANENDQSKNNILGMLLVAISTFLLLSAFALFQHVSNNLDVSLFECIIISNCAQHCISWILWFLPSSITKKPNYIKLWYAEKEYRYSIWFRGFFYWLDLYLYWIALTLLPLGDAETIYFLCPMFVAFGARIFLKEKFSKTFPVVFIITAIGLTILCQPKWVVTDHPAREISTKGIIFCVIGCMAWAAMNLMVRRAQKAHWIQLELVSSLQSFAIWTPFLLLINYFLNEDYNLDNDGSWRISLEIISYIVSIAALTIIALMFVVLGFQYGEATKVAWMEYWAVPFGFVYQWIIFDEIPNIFEILGAVIVIVGCLIGAAEEYYNYRKQLRKESIGIQHCNSKQNSHGELLIELAEHHVQTCPSIGMVAS
eukprot:120284_1